MIQQPVEKYKNMLLLKCFGCVKTKDGETNKKVSAELASDSRKTHCAAYMIATLQQKAKVELHNKSNMPFC